MNDEEFAEEMNRRKAVVVHFSHLANMREGGTFPEDLQAAIDNREIWPLSCSVLFPGHAMTPVGSVGVIFDPRIANVVSVSNKDSGSFLGNDGVDQSSGDPLDSKSFQETFAVAGPYNEWRVKGANVRGIFVVDSRRIFAKMAFTFRDPMTGVDVADITWQQITLPDVFAAFPGLSVFTLDNNGLIELK